MMCSCWLRTDAPYPMPLMQLRAGVPQRETSGPQGNLTAVVLLQQRRCCRQQGTGVLLFGMVEDVVGGVLFDDLTAEHHADAVGDVPHGVDVVGDEHQAQTELFLQVKQQVQHLCTH